MKSDTFLETFAGDFVEILTDMIIKQTMPVDEGLQEVTMPMTIQGFVMDTDEEFVYLSADGENIDQALPLKTIKHIQVIKEVDPLNEMLETIDVPEDTNGYN